MASSNVQTIQLQIGKLLLIGILISVIIVSIGGSFYLIAHGHENAFTQAFFLQTPQPSSLETMLRAVWQLSPVGIMQLGIFFLVVTQLLRVILVMWFFIKERDAIFIAISLFIMLIVIYSLFWQF